MILGFQALELLEQNPATPHQSLKPWGLVATDVTCAVAAELMVRVCLGEGEISHTALHSTCVPPWAGDTPQRHCAFPLTARLLKQWIPRKISSGFSS